MTPEERERYKDKIKSRMDKVYKETEGTDIDKAQAVAKEMILLAKELHDNTKVYKCPKCGYKTKSTPDFITCNKCGATMVIK